MSQKSKIKVANPKNEWFKIKDTKKRVKINETNCICKKDWFKKSESKSWVKIEDSNSDPKLWVKINDTKCMSKEDWFKNSWVKMIESKIRGFKKWWKMYLKLIT